jgi:hypothetical protein
VPGWLLEPLVSWVVAADVERIFAYRQEAMRGLFA